MPKTRVGDRSDNESFKFKKCPSGEIGVRVLTEPGCELDTNAVFSGLKTAIKITTVPVSTTAVALPTTALVGRNSISLFNKSSVTLYVGPSNVTADDAAATGGWEIPAGFTFNIDITDAITLFGISTEAISVKVMELA